MKKTKKTKKPKLMGPFKYMVLKLAGMVPDKYSLRFHKIDPYTGGRKFMTLFYDVRGVRTTFTHMESDTSLFNPPAKDMYFIEKHLQGLGWASEQCKKVDIELEMINNQMISMYQYTELKRKHKMV